MERLAQAAKYLIVFFMGYFLGIYTQKEYQEEEINNLHQEYKKEKKRDLFIIDSIQCNEQTYKIPLDRLGYPVEEMIKRESDE